MNSLKCKICLKTLNKGKIYCSKDCYWKKSPKFEYSCRNCSKLFWTYPSFQKVGEGFLCSKQCRIEWIKMNYQGEDTRLNPDKAKWARTYLNHAIERKGFVRKPCGACGNEKSHGHHEDYSKPLEVEWLCHKHHQLLHHANSIPRV